MRKACVATVAALLVALAVNVRRSGAQAPTGAERATIAIEGVLARQSLVRSVYGWFVLERYFADDARRLIPDAENHVIQLFFWADGSGWREDQVRWRPNGELVSRSGQAFDGQRYRAYTSEGVDWSLYEVDSAMPDVPAFLDCSPWPDHGTPSSRLVEAAVDRIEEDEIGGRRCWRIESPRAGGGRSLRWVAPDLGFAVAKALHRWPTSAEEPLPGSGSQVVDRFERYGDLWVPTIARRVIRSVGPAGQDVVGIVERFTVVELHLNEETSRLPFSVLLPWPVGAAVGAGGPHEEVLGGDPTMYIERIRQPIDESLTSEDPVEVER